MYYGIYLFFSLNSGFEIIGHVSRARICGAIRDGNRIDMVQTIW